MGEFYNSAKYWFLEKYFFSVDTFWLQKKNKPSQPELHRHIYALIIKQ